MLILKHLKNTSTCFDLYSDHLQGARRFLVKVTEFKIFFKTSIVVMRQQNVWCVCVVFSVGMYVVGRFYPFIGHEGP